MIHDKGNEENGFDRFDFQPNGADSLHFNFSYTRSWFQTPNSYDAQFHPCNTFSDTCNAAGTLVVNPVTGIPLGPSDQRSQIKTFNIAPSWVHLIGTTAVVTVGGFVRRDQYNYYPSADPFNDFSSDLQSATAGQSRTLTNAGVHADVSYVKGAHNLKIGATYQHTFLTENDTIGIVDPAFLGGPGSCPDPTNPACPYDLTQGGSLFHFHGHTDVKELALYIQDTITKGNWSFNVWVFAATFIAAYPAAAKQSLARVSPTTSSGRIRFFAFPTPASLRLPSMKTWLLRVTGIRRVSSPAFSGAWPGSSWPAQRFSCRVWTGVRQAFGHRRRLHVEIHA